MKKYLYTISASALALTMSGVPLLAAHAQENGPTRPMYPIAQVQGGPGSNGPMLRPGQEPPPREGNGIYHGGMMRPGAPIAGPGGAAGSTTALRARIQEIIQHREAMLASSTADGRGNAMSIAVRLRAIAQFASHMDELFGSSTPAQNAAQLQQMIQEREHLLAQAASSTATSSRPILEHAIRVNLAVHALLAARNLIGSSTAASQITNLAQQIQSSLASTTEAQARIQARGFWTRLFFGGDTQAANTLSQVAAQNQQRIERITSLLDQASTSAQVKTQLQAQLQSLEQAQASTTEQASQQKGLWGLFSWRLF